MPSCDMQPPAYHDHLGEGRAALISRRLGLSGDLSRECRPAARSGQEPRVSLRAHKRAEQTARALFTSIYYLQVGDAQVDLVGREGGREREREADKLR